MAKYDNSNNGPGLDTVQHYFNHLNSFEQKTMLRLQVEKIRHLVLKDLKSIHPDRGLPLNRGTVLVFESICNRLKVSPYVKFVSMDLYDRFMTIFVDQMRIEINKARKATKNKNEKTGIYKEYMARFRSQVELRILTCIQLASKLYMDLKNHVTTSQIQTILLKKYHRNFTIQSIMKSEARVFKTLNYKLTYVNTMDCIEAVLICLDIDAENYMKVYNSSVDILGHLRLERIKIYTIMRKNMVEVNEEEPSVRLRVSMRRHKSKSEKRKIDPFLLTECNPLVEASAVVALSLFIHMYKEYKALVKLVKEVTGIGNDDFISLSAIILRTVQEDSQQSRQSRNFKTPENNVRPVPVGLGITRQ